MPFKPCGKIRRSMTPCRCRADGWTLGTLVIAAADVPKLLNGHAVDVQFVQERPDPRGLRRSRRHGRALPERPGGDVRIESRLMSAPLAAVQKVLSGQQLAARLSAPAPIIDADREQAKSIDHDLVRSFA